MDKEEKKSAERKPVEKWQLIIQWIGAVCWIAVVIVDIVYDQKLFLTVMQSVAAVLFTVSAIILTKRYRRDHHA